MNALTRLAVVGTGKAGGTDVASGTEVDGLVAAIAEPERRLLVQLGALAVYESAGRRAASVTPPEAAPEDARPPCSAVATELFSTLLEGEQRELLAEACRLLSSSGRRLPWELLPKALGVRDAASREALAPVLGPRAVWLGRIARDETFSWIVADAVAAKATGLDERLFEEGSAQERVAALRTLLSKDRGAARRRLAEVLPKEKAELRAAFVRALAAGLSAEDEPFLETCLDDRAATVVEAAASLLARLPGSALAKRMSARLESVLVYRPPEAPKGLLSRAASALGALGRGTGARGTLVVSPPSTADAAWRRDGLPSKAPQGKGEKAHFLEALVASTSPAALRALVPVSMPDLVALLRADDYRGALLSGLARAAITFGDGPLVAALFDLSREGKAEDELGEHRNALAAALPAEEIECRVLEPRCDAALLATLLPRLGRPFSREASERLLDRARKKAGERRSEEVALLGPLAVGLSPGVLPEALLPFPLPEPAEGEPWELRTWRSAVTRFHETAQIRLALRRELEPQERG